MPEDSQPRVEIKVLTAHRDARGTVFEPLDAAEIAGYRNVHVVLSKPGAIRGNHRHVVGTEVTTVVGPMFVRYRCGGERCDRTVPEGEIWQFRFPPGAAHAFKNIGDSTSILASFNTEAHRQDAPDVEREVLLEV